jgi:hypothetical protein
MAPSNAVVNNNFLIFVTLCVLPEMVGAAPPARLMQHQPLEFIERAIALRIVR